jgi:hypothetical protein
MFDWLRFIELRKAYIAIPAIETLEMIRHFLDTNGMPMPKPRYIYQEQDVRTWKYLDSNYNAKKKSTTIKQNYNPSFAY